MKCRAAVLRGAGKDWEIQEITLDPSREGEVLVKTAVAGHLPHRRPLRDRRQRSLPGNANGWCTPT